MSRWKNTSKNVALNTTIQMTGVLRRHCVNAYNTAAQEFGIDTLRRVVTTLRATPHLRSNSETHHFLSNYAFFAADSVLGERRVFVRQFQYLVRQDMRAMREQIMASPFAAWECVGDDSDGRDGFSWRAIGLPDPGEYAHDAPTYSPTQVRVITDSDGIPVSAKLGDIRAGWLVDLDRLQIANSASLQENLAGCAALIFSMEMQPQAGARLKRVETRRGWHGEVSPRKFEFMRDDYERDILTQLTSPDYGLCGLDKFYFLPVRLRQTFPERFFKELTRRIALASGPENHLWHIQIARAAGEAERAELLEWFDFMRYTVEQRVNYYSSDSVDLESLRRIASDEDLLDWMGVEHDLEIDLGEFPPLPSQPIELLDLTDEWLEKTQLKPHIPISRARKSLEDRHKQLQQEFEDSVTRHLARMRWVCLIKSQRALREDTDAQKNAAVKKPRSAHHLKGYNLRLPDYSEARKVARDLFGDTLEARPVREFLAPLKGRLKKLEQAMIEWNEGEEKEVLTLGDLPMSRTTLQNARGIGPSTVDTIEELLLEELLAWPRALDTRAANAQQAGEQLADGLDELGDLFG